MQPNLRFQIRNGTEDVKIFIKIYNEFNYTRFRELPISVLDPCDECAAWDTKIKKTLAEMNNENVVEVNIDEDDEP